MRRLKYENQIPYLFDGFNKPKPKSCGPTKIYEGKISRFNVKLIFNSQSTSNLCAKFESSLNKAHAEALERLLQHERDSIM